jgi:hypothetical protein
MRLPVRARVATVIAALALLCGMAVSPADLPGRDFDGRHPAPDPALYRVGLRRRIDDRRNFPVEPARGRMFNLGLAYDL